MRRRRAGSVLVVCALTAGLAGLAALWSPGAVVAATRGSVQPATVGDTVGDTVVVGAVGDMACDPSDPKFNGGVGTAQGCQGSRVSSLMVADTSLSAVLGLGDYQYDCGDPADYAVSYNPTWGRLDPLMDPVAGNHEYKTGTDAFGATCPSDNTTAAGYFEHFGPAAHASTEGHFSFDLGGWHLIALNSNCGAAGVGGCGATSPQTKWLEQDLAATTQPCIAAFWHQPLYTAAKFKGTAYRPWWNALYAAHADVVLNGHVHNYQRYPALTPNAVKDAANGITQYTVGTGGEGFTKFVASVTPKPTVHLQTFGYLRLTLSPTGWSAEFVDATGAVADRSSGTCHA